MGFLIQTQFLYFIYIDTTRFDIKYLQGIFQGRSPRDFIMSRDRFTVILSLHIQDYRRKNLNNDTRIFDKFTRFEILRVATNN